MPDFTVIATSAARESEQAELDVVVADFEMDGEAVGYARRMAEETHRLAAQLDLDFDYSHVSVFTGEVDPDTADSGHDAFVGMWFFTDDGVEWATQEALAQAGDEDEGGAAA